jgi:hypothetical protein
MRKLRDHIDELKGMCQAFAERTRDYHKDEDAQDALVLLTVWSYIAANVSGIAAYNNAPAQMGTPESVALGVLAAGATFVASMIATPVGAITGFFAGAAGGAVVGTGRGSDRRHGDQSGSSFRRG